MIKSDREILDTAIIRAILDRIDTVHVGINDGVYPYVVPLSFGFDLDEETLDIYIHCALKGYKLHLMQNDPHVCCTFSAFSNFPRKLYKGHRHDFRSVMAFGEVRLIDREQEPRAYARAIRRLLEHYDRIPKNGEKRDFPNFDVNGIHKMHMLQVTCRRDNVFAKSEFPLRSVDDVPFTDVYGSETDNVPFDIADLQARPKRPSRFDLD